MLTEYAQAYVSGWGDFTTNDFQDAMGRPPRSIAEFARDHAKAFTNHPLAIERMTVIQ